MTEVPRPRKKQGFTGYGEHGVDGGGVRDTVTPLNKLNSGWKPAWVAGERVRETRNETYYTLLFASYIEICYA